MKIPKPPDQVQKFYSHYHWEMNHLEAYIGYAQDGLELTKQKVNKDFDKEILKNRQYWQEIEQMRDTDNKRFEKVYVQILRASFIVAGYSIFELNLLDFCKLMKKQFKLTDGYKKIRGQSVIESCKTYLSTKAGLEILTPDIETLWSTIDDYRIIRNSIAHEDSNMNNAHEPLEVKRIVSNSKSLRMYRGGSFIVTKDKFALDFCSNTRNYFLKLAQSYRKKKKDPRPLKRQLYPITN